MKGVKTSEIKYQYLTINYHSKTKVAFTKPLICPQTALEQIVINDNCLIYGNSRNKINCGHTTTVINEWILKSLWSYTHVWNHCKMQFECVFFLVNGRNTWDTDLYFQDLEMTNRKGKQLSNWYCKKRYNFAKFTNMLKL